MKTTGDMKILWEAMTGRNITQTALAEKLGMKQPSLSGNMSRKRISLETFIKILDVLDYDVVVKDRKTGEDEWRVRI